MTPESVAHAVAAQQDVVSSTGPSSSNFDYVPNREPPFDGSLSISDQDAHALLNEYRTNLQPLFPFVVIDDNSQPATFRQTRPFLFRAITSVAMYYDFPRQIAITSDSLKYLGGRMLVQGEKDLDLLQGILVLVAW